MQAIIMTKVGDASVLKIKEVEDPKIKKDEILIKQTAIGVNFFDICFRRGQYKINEMPAILGTEACGIVEAVGSEVINFKVGDRVAYGTGPLGAYSQKRAINQRYVVKVSQDITDIQVAASLAKGLMAHTLLFRTYLIKQAKRILVHAAAGGVGQFLCQWAKHQGVEVIGTVGSDAKISVARQNGCDHVINYKTQDFLKEVARITKDGGVGMVLDGVGKDTLVKSLECLWPMGICASYGESSGNTEKLDLNYMVANSLYLTRPTLALYKANQIELAMAAIDVLGFVANGVLKPQITTFAFKDVAKAHKALEGRETTGSIVLTL